LHIFHLYLPCFSFNQVLCGELASGRSNRGTGRRTQGDRESSSACCRRHRHVYLKLIC
jgi:hypothetical protein